MNETKQYGKGATVSLRLPLKAIRSYRNL